MTDRKYYNGINILKFAMAFILAQIYHYYVFFRDIPCSSSIPVFFIRKYGHLMVELFFVISGYFIMNSLDKNNDNFKAIPFLLNKIKRLYPLFALSVIIAFIGQFITIKIYGQPIITRGADNIYLSFFLSMLCINSGWITGFDSTSINTPSWYISVLIICYIIASLIVKLIKSKIIRNITFALIVAVGIDIIVFGLNCPLFNFASARGYRSFFMGVLVYLLINSKLMYAHRKIIMTTAYLLLVIMLVLPFTGFYYNYLSVSIFVAPVILFFFFVPNKTDNKIDPKVSRLLSEWSYSLFLFHMPIIILIKLIERIMGLNPNYSNWLVWITVTTITLFVSIAINCLYKKVLHGKLGIK